MVSPSFRNRPHLTGKSTMSLILSRQMKLRKEKRLSWMIRTLGSRQRSSCLEASRCCWHFGQYLQSRVHLLVEEYKEKVEEEVN